jgi:heavy metal sensor kinase
VGYTAVLSLTLAVAAMSFYLVQRRSRMDSLDEDLRRIQALVARKLAMELSEDAPLPEAAADALEDVNVPGLPIAVWDVKGALLAGRWDVAAPGPPEGSGTVDTAAGPFRVVVQRAEGTRDAFLVAVAAPLSPLQRELAQLRRALVTGTALALLLAAAGGWWIARAALAPVGALARQAAAIDDRTPGARLVAPNPEDELGRMARAFNDVLERLETAIAAQRRFMADASHELRTPVSIARTAAEVALGHPERTEADYRDALGLVALQTRRLARMVDDMFLLARADAAGLRLSPGLLYLGELVAECARDARVLAGDRGVRVDWQGDGDLPFTGDERLLRQLLMNLLGNAVRHTPDGGCVRVAVAAEPLSYEVRVVDAGPGIPPADRERVFERFVRLDASGRAPDGAGLGLPIARAIAEAHGGTLALASGDAPGSTFLLRLPRS